jgi:pyridinium-3,5-biscarboxylic acid mononucleotide sulfurtransferase
VSSEPEVAGPAAAGGRPGPEGAALDAAVTALRAELAAGGPAVVAFSGGADSALLAWMASDVLGPERALCVTAVSASLAPEERAECRALAGEWGLRWREVRTGELEDPAYRANGADRCYHCKASLMAALGPLAAAEGATVLLGVNLDDLEDHRPGQRAAAEAGARFPLVAAGFTNATVRAVSRRLGLRTWDKPAAACLASRVPYGTPVTLGTLRSVAEAEAGLRALGFAELRVRHHGDVARVEVPEVDLPSVVERRQAVVAAVRRAGYAFVALDLEGFRSGSLNRVLPSPARSGGGR